MAAVAIGIVLASPAGAETLTGNVSRIYVTSTGMVNFRIQGACKSGTYFQFQLTEEDSARKAWYAMLLNAATQRQPVRVALADACDPAINQTVAYMYQDYE
ncbi:hypothetical protein C9I47_0048 [Lysobacter maris]|uniref:Uncharacterized protein n=2 Tax=Marilutibacter maris TaxID=1605891 RepID=A0A2U9T459_9GAMM|nr:hypothetical protein C9I47_0048 [Lysobacter maris]